MPKVTPEHIQARRGQILEAAFRCFSRKGFHASTMREICEEAKLSAGAVYSYFSGKEEIISALAEVGRRNTREQIDRWAASAPSTPPLGQLLQAMLALGREAKAARDSVRLDLRLSSEALDNPSIRELMARGMSNATAAFADLARRAQTAGTLDPALDPDAVALVVLALYHGLSVHSLLDPEIDQGAALDLVASLFSARLGTDGSPS